MSKSEKISPFVKVWSNKRLTTNAKKSVESAPQHLPAELSES